MTSQCCWRAGCRTSGRCAGISCLPWRRLLDCISVCRSPQTRWSDGGYSPSLPGCSSTSPWSTWSVTTDIILCYCGQQMTDWFGFAQCFTACQLILGGRSYWFRSQAFTPLVKPTIGSMRLTKHYKRGVLGIQTDQRIMGKGRNSAKREASPEPILYPLNVP